jgi:hypothetical protein
MRLRGVKVGQPVPSENSIVAELWLVTASPSPIQMQQYECSLLFKLFILLLSSLLKMEPVTAATHYPLVADISQAFISSTIPSKLVRDLLAQF